LLVVFIEREQSLSKSFFDANEFSKGIFRNSLISQDINVCQIREFLMAFQRGIIFHNKKFENFLIFGLFFSQKS